MDDHFLVGLRVRSRQLLLGHWEGGLSEHFQAFGVDGRLKHDMVCSDVGADEGFEGVPRVGAASGFPEVSVEEVE
jgi:hypothetical protein